ncbi:type II secretion system protein J [Hoeflea sp. TYP-13]|uniref:type II secretion system protein J n=1 Tax=Hoeflea sp. TYP-13 TaxID=3230023 RepID=UPI0034C65D54
MNRAEMHHPGSHSPNKISSARRENNSVSEAGFSLAEILVVLAILALITGLTTVFLGQLRKASQIHAEREIQRELNSVSNYMERTLETALALPIDISDNRNRAFFVGNASGVSFVSSSRIGIQEAAMRTKRIELQPGEKNGELIQTIAARRFTKSTLSNQPPLTVSVADGINGIKFEYLGALSGSSDAQWTNSWSQNRSLPRAVRFKITASRNGRQFTSRGFARLRNSGH